MDPATSFLLYLVAGLSLGLLASAVHPVLESLSRISIALPIGGRFAAVMVSVALLGGVGATRASIEPASHRMVQMADTSRQIMVSTHSTHTVAKGDSLWAIARSLLSPDASGQHISSLWREIYDVNRSLIGDDPNLIHPGQVLQLPGE